MNNNKYYHGAMRLRPVFCRICGSAVLKNDFAMVFSGKAVCDSCISEISTREILRICEFSSKKELLYALGFSGI